MFYLFASKYMKRTIDKERRINKRLYTINEAALYLGRTEWGVRELVWSRELPVIRRGQGGKQYIDVYDLDEWIEKNKSVLR